VPQKPVTPSVWEEIDLELSAQTPSVATPAGKSVWDEIDAALSESERRRASYGEMADQMGPAVPSVLPMRADRMTSRPQSAILPQVRQPAATPPAPIATGPSLDEIIEAKKTGREIPRIAPMAAHEPSADQATSRAIATARTAQPATPHTEDAPPVPFGLPTAMPAHRQQVRIKPEATVTDRAIDVGLTAVKGAISLPETAVGLADVGLQGFLNAGNPNGPFPGGILGKGLEAVGFHPALAKQVLDQYYSDRQKFANQSVEQADGLIATAVEALRNPETIVHAGIESLALMGAGGLAGRGMAKLGMARHLAPGVGEGVVALGSGAEGLRQQTPTGTLTAPQTAIAGASGALTTGFGLLGSKIAKGLRIADVDTMLAGAAADGEAARGLVQSIIYGAVSEGLLEELPQSVQEQVAQNIALDKPWHEGVDHAAVVGAFTGGLMGGGSQVIDRAGSALRPTPPSTPEESSRGQAPSPAPGAAGEAAPPVVPPVAARPGDTLMEAPVAPSPDATPVAPATTPAASDPIIQAIDEALAETPAPAPEFAPVGAEDRSQLSALSSQLSAPGGDVLDRVTGKLASGERLGTPEARAAFEEQQRVDLSRKSEVGSAKRESGDVHKFSSTQVDLPPAAATKIRELAASIPDTDLAADGRESTPHVTVKYGLHTRDVEEVRSLLANERPVTVTLGRTSHFAGVEDGTADAVMVDVDSPDLHRLNAKIATALKTTDTYPNYKPHATIAYVKPGLGEKYSGRTDLEGETITLDAVTFSSRTGDTFTIPLGPASGGRSAAEMTDEELAASIIAEVDAELAGAQPAADPVLLVGSRFKAEGREWSVKAMKPGQGTQLEQVGTTGPDKSRVTSRWVSDSELRVMLAEDAAPAASEGDAEANAPTKGAKPNVTHNAERDSIEVRFKAKPTPEVLAALKGAGFRWAKGNRAWYRGLKGRSYYPVAEEVRKLVRTAGGVAGTPAIPVTPKIVGEPAGNGTVPVTPKGRREVVSADGVVFDLQTVDPDKLIDSLSGPAKGSVPVTQKREAIAEQRAKNKATRDAAIQRIKDKLKNQATAGIDPEIVTEMVTVMRTYISDGILDFKEAVLLFQEDFGANARKLDRYFEIAWRRLRNEDRKVADVLAEAAPNVFDEIDAEVSKITVKPFNLSGKAAEVQARAIAALEADPRGFKNRYLEQFGRVLNADNASELFEDYAASDEARATLGAAVRAPASALIESLFEDLLAQPPLHGKEPIVVFTAGGNASGKTSGITDERSADIVFDSTFSSPTPSQANVERVLASGRDARVRYVYRDPLKALLDGALPRAMGEANGRTVTVRGLAATHIGSRETVLKLAEHYAGDSRVTFAIRENTEDDIVDRDTKWLKGKAYNDRDVLEGHLFDALDAEHAAGRIDDAVFEGTKGVGRRAGEDRRGDGRGVSQERREKPRDSAAPADGTSKDEVGADGESTRRPGAADSQPLDGSPAEDDGPPASGRKAGGRGTRGGAADTGGRGAGGVRGDGAGSGQGTAPGDLGVPADGGRRPTPAKRRSGGMARPGKSGLDYRISDADAIGSGGDTAKIRANLAAIELLKRIESEGRKATKDEQAVLVKYVGWGGLASIFKPENWYSGDGKKLKDLLTDEEYAAARASTPNAHYTSKDVVDAVWSAVKRLGIDHGRVLEPAMGVGHFFGLMPRELAGDTTWAGVELDSTSGRIAQQLYQSAQIQIKGFEAALLPDNFFDLAIGNPPFGNYPIHDPEFRGRPRALSSAIHNYFFAKALDKVKPGGVMAFITSHYTMDAKDSTVRTYLAERATLLGAIRLPNTAFKANAGTEVVTDIIFLQKREQPVRASELSKADLLWTRTGSVLDGKATINEYFIRNPHMVMGEHALEGSMYSDKEYTVTATGDLAEQLKAAIKKLPRNVVDTAPVQKPVEEQLEEFVPAPDVVKPYAFTLQDGKLMVRDGGRLTKVTVPDGTKTRIVGMMGVRDVLRDTMRTMLTAEATDAEVKVQQGKLAKVYDAFVKKHGYIHDPANQRAFGDDPDKPLLLSLEDWDSREKKATKAPIFTKRTLSPARPITHVETAGEGLILSLNVRGRIDWNYMSTVVGQSVEDLQAALAGQVYENPAGGWDVADAYLSGDVRQKLDEAKAAAALDPKFQANVEALEKVQPEPLGPADVSGRLGASWIPASDVSAFVDEILEERGAVKVAYVPAIAAWAVQERGFNIRTNTNNNTKWGTPRATAVKILDDALNGRFISVYDTTTDGKRVLNPKETAAAREKQAALEAEFASWVWRDSARADRLLEFYNRHFNNIRLRTFDGTHLTLGGMALEVVLRSHQKDAIWRTLQTPNTLLAHVVGAGKTFVMIGSAMEKRRLGLAKKPMIVVPNHLVEQTAKEFLRMYPAANVLMTTKKDFEAGARKKLMARIATGDWDAVIVAHSSFGKVPVSNERFNAFLEDQLAELEEALRAAKHESSGRDATVKELEKAKRRLEAKLKDRRKEDTQDKTVTWEEIGVDALYVDEAHLFKNLYFPTRMTRLAGLPNSESDRAFDMLLKVRHVQEVNNGGGVTFATGTPISNTMAEMYTMQRYLGMDDLASRGLAMFDSWAKQFGVAVNSLELAPEGRGYRMRTRFAEFTNWAELAKMYRTFADVLTADKLKLPTPKVKGGSGQPVTSPASPELKAYVTDLVERAEQVRKGRVDPKKDNMLKIVGEGRKVALDLRLVGFAHPDPEGKLFASAERISDIYFRWKDKKGTQLVFSDLGTPSSDGFNVYDELKRILVERHKMPADQIAFIHDADTDAKKQRLFNDVNAGRIRVLIGSTEKMGAGTNVQKRLVALHHLDAPWRPSDIEQREGRIIRQGNEFRDADPDGFEVEIYRYLTEGSFDAYMWQTLESKAKFIAASTSDNLTARKIEDMDAVVMNAAEMKAAASGDPRVFEKVKLDSDVQRLEILASSHEDTQWALRRNLANLPVELTQQQNRLAVIEEALAALAPAEPFEVEIGGKTFTEPGKAGTELRRVAWDVFEKHTTKVRVPIGKHRGMVIDVITEDGGSRKKPVKNAETGEITERQANFPSVYVRHEASGWVAYIASPDTIATSSSSDDVGLMQKVRHAASGLPGQRTEQLGIIANTEKRLKQAQEGVKPFEHAEKLKELKARQAKLNAELNLDVQSQATAAPVVDEADGDEIRTETGGSDDGVSSMAGPSTGLPQPKGPAIPVTPRMRPTEIVKRLRTGLGAIPVNVGRFRQQALGIYKQKPQAIRVKVANDLQTVAHEFGHHVDISILGIDRKDKRWKNELIQLGMATSKPSYTQSQIRQEGAAEFFRLFLIEPHTAQKEAPEYFAEFERRLDAQPHAELKKLLLETRADLQGLISQDPGTRGELRIDFTGTDTPSAFQRFRENPKATIRDLSRLWIDDLKALRVAVEEMADARPLEFRKNAYVLARVARGSASMAEGFLEVGVRGRNGRFIAPSLADAISPVKGQLEEFSKFLVALRVLEVRGLKNKETGMSADEALGLLDRYVHRGYVGALHALEQERAEGLTNRTQAEYDAAIAAAEHAVQAEVKEGFESFDQARQNVSAFQRGLLQYAREFHALSDAQFRKLEREFFYVPLQRVMDDVAGAFAGGARKFANRTLPIKRMKGSGRDIINPLEAIIRNTFAMVDMVEKNEAMAALVQQADRAVGSGKWLEKIPTPQVATKFNLSQVGDNVREAMADAGVDLPDNFELDELVRVFTPASFTLPGSNIVTVIRNGKREFWQVNDQPLYDALTAIGAQATSKLIEWAEKPAKLLRAGATLTPGFIARNPTRDTVVAFMQSRYGFIPVYDSVRGFIELALGTDAAKLFRTSGVMQSALVGMDRDLVRKEIRNLSERDRIDFFKHVVFHPVDLLRALSSSFESATRMGEFRLALNAGGRERRAGVLGIAQRLTSKNRPARNEETLTRATLAARDVTTDFQRAGVIAREINRFDAFFNARLQGYVRMAETAKRDPVGTALNATMLGLLSWALWWMHEDDEEYFKLPDWERNAYWHIPVPGGYMKVAKPFEWAAPANLVEAGLDYVKKQNPDALRRIRPEGTHALVSVLVPTALLPLIEAQANYSAFRDTHIVSPWQEVKDPALQYNEWTTETGKQIGELLNVSPAKVDHVIFGYGAGFARGIVDYGLDPALKGLGIVPRGSEEPAKKWQRVPVAGTFYRDREPDNSSQPIQDFYRAYEQVQGYEATMKAYAKTGEREKAEARRTAAQAQPWFSRAAQIKATKEDFEEAGRIIDAIYKATPDQLTPAEKRERLDKVYRLMNDQALDALGRKKPPLPVAGRSGTR